MVFTSPAASGLGGRGHLASPWASTRPSRAAVSRPAQAVGRAAAGGRGGPRSERSSGRGRGGGSRRGAEKFTNDGEERFFVDDEAAAKLRRLLKRRGAEGLVDAQGYGLVPLDELEQKGPRGGASRPESSSGSGRDTAGNGDGEEEENGSDFGGSRSEREPRRGGEGSGRADAAASAYGSGAAAAGAAEGSDRPAPRRRPLFDGGEDGGSGDWDRDARPAPRQRRNDFDRDSGRREHAAPGGSRDRERGERFNSSGGDRGAAGGSFAPERPRAAPAAARLDVPIVRLDAGPDMGTFFAGDSWRDLGANSEVVAALKALGITRPSHIQAEAYKALHAEGSRHVALADQAGSGKTLAYLVPLLQSLKEEEAAAGKPGTVPRSPRVLIVTPTTELCQQVHRVLKALSGAGLRLRSGLMTGGQGEELRRAKAMRTQKEALEAGVDVAVMTPGRAVQLLSSGALSLEATRAVVLDEVDVLCAGEAVYREQVEPLQSAAPLTARFLLVSATLPQHTYEELRALFPGLTQAFGPGLHRVSAGVVEELVDCSGGDEVSLESGVQRKLEALSACLDRHKSQRVVVFCNKIEACRAVENHLRRKHGKAPGGTPVEVHAYHDAVSEPARHAALGAFLAPSSPPPTTPTARQPRPVVLVCTDRTSRGIDSAWCDHVVLFDFPRDPSEYVRRAGRTARGAGGRGVVSALVLGKQVPLAQDIMDANQKGRPVHRIPGF